MYIILLTFFFECVLGILFVILIPSAQMVHATKYQRMHNGYSKVHKIRHQRHLLRNFMNPYRFGEYTQECIGRFSDSINRPAGCPEKHCKKNRDCWEEYGASKLCVCDPNLCGLVCMEYDVQCPVPKQPLNGHARYTSLMVGDQVDYFCKPGYVVKGPRKRYCQANKKWSKDEPNCTDQTDLCFSAPDIPNTQVTDGRNRQDYRNGEQVNLTCKMGFEDKDKSYTTARCVGNEWTWENISCQKISCKKLEDPLNGRTMYNDNYTYNSVAIQFCNDGYKIECSTIGKDGEKNCKRNCMANKEWDGEPANCSQILCDNLKAPENGVIIGHWNAVNSIKNIKCNEGYQLSGSHLRKCLHDGRWDGSNATCTVRDCGPPPQIPFAKIIYTATTHGANAKYQCQVGTTLFGKSPFLKCGEINNNSTWLPKPEPQCQRDCLPFTVKNAHVYVYDRRQSRDRILQLDVQHDTTVEVKCYAGFELNRIGMPKCNNGSWNYKPECLEASCSSRPPSMKYSTVRFYSLKHNSVARYYCHSGYRIKYVNNATSYTSIDIKCIKGNWTEIPSEGCQPTTCNKPQTPINGKIFLMGQLSITPLTDELIKPVHNRIVRYECQRDYRLKGPKIAVCLDGQWSPPEPPMCEFIMHDELPLSWLYYQSADRK